MQDFTAKDGNISLKRTLNWNDFTEKVGSPALSNLNLIDPVAQRTEYIKQSRRQRMRLRFFKVLLFENCATGSSQKAKLPFQCTRLGELYLRQQKRGEKETLSGSHGFRLRLRGNGHRLKNRVLKADLGYFPINCA
jgi:hypothetical protein